MHYNDHGEIITYLHVVLGHALARRRSIEQLTTHPVINSAKKREKIQELALKAFIQSRNNAPPITGIWGGGGELVGII